MKRQLSPEKKDHNCLLLLRFHFGIRKNEKEQIRSIYFVLCTAFFCGIFSVCRSQVTKMASEAVLQIQTKIIGDPRLVSAAGQLEIPVVYFLGSLLHLLCKALDYAEDGDLWRGDEDATVRFISASAGWPGDAGRYAAVLQQERWLNEWIIAEWLDYAGDYLYRKYKSSNRGRLVEIHAKSGREYGKGRARERKDASRSHPQGCNWDVNGLFKNHPLTLTPETQNPYTLNQQEKKDNPITPNPLPREEEKTGESSGDCEEKEGGRIIRFDTGDFYKFVQEGLWDRGVALSYDQLDCSGLNYVEVFEAFKPILVFHSVVTVNSFYFRCRRCDCSPAWWMMVYMDKVHAVYRIRPNESTWLEDGADPVALTMAALLPSYKRKHNPTEAAKQLFLEIMIDYNRLQNGESARWSGSITGNFIAKELDLRKGKAGKIA